MGWIKFIVQYLHTKQQVLTIFKNHLTQKNIVDSKTLQNLIDIKYIKYNLYK